ncbi:MAG: hypothetical protein RIQ52_452 [Pseudomonadota bacterium]
MQKSLHELDKEEWEALCDGCGKCCLHKIEDEDTGEIFYTRVACRLLDIPHCRCTQYGSRHMVVPECMQLEPGFEYFEWMPTTCAYRLRHENRPLPDWHPLVHGSPAKMHEEKHSVRHLAIPEATVHDPANFVLEETL